MPIYEYKCEKCGNLDEHLMRFSDPDPEGCSKCGDPVHKIVSQTSFSLKGTGWYVTDYKKSGAPESSPTPAGETLAATPTAPEPAAGATPAPAAAVSSDSGGSKGGSGSGD